MFLNLLLNGLKGVSLFDSFFSVNIKNVEYANYYLKRAYICKKIFFRMRHLKVLFSVFD